jgi:hypothetical protein
MATRLTGATAARIPKHGRTEETKLDCEHAASSAKSDAILGHVASWGDRFPKSSAKPRETALSIEANHALVSLMQSGRWLKRVQSLGLLAPN